MTVAQTIAQRVSALPEVEQREVLDFVEFLKSRREPAPRPESDASWAALSLAAAMRDMEEEATPYTAADVKESFQ